MVSVNVSGVLNSTLIKRIIYVDDNNTVGPWNGTIEYPFRYIQDGINAANPGDTVYVFNGTYFEQIDVNKSIDLIGEDRNTTIIDLHYRKMININANQVVINNFTIQYGYGIRLYSSENTVSRNIFKKISGWNIYLVSSQNNFIFQNTIQCDEQSCIGIYLYISSNNNIISDNYIMGDDFLHEVNGIRIEDYSQNNTITNNIISNVDIGVYIIFISNNNVVSNNIFFNDGLLIFDSYQNLVINNTVNNKPLIYLEGKSNLLFDSEDVGQILLIDCENVSIQNTEISNTTIGIELWGSNNCTISGNDISYNYLGLSVRWYSNENIIIENNIHSNNYSIEIMEFSCNNIVKKNSIFENEFYGIWLAWLCNNNIFSSNDICFNQVGIKFTRGNDNIISDNNISSNEYMGLYIDSQNDNNIISRNTISGHYWYGIWISNSDNNSIYHNNFINNVQNAYEETSTNIWDNGYPSGGNYWDNYTGIDVFSGPGQNISGSDGIGDTHYNISGGSNQDLYPLMEPWVLIPGDLDHDGDVDYDDFALFLQTFGHNIGDPLFNPEADYNSNGVVDLVDYQIWIMYYRDFVASHTDILIGGISANYTSSASTIFSAEHDTAIIIKLTATIKNNGTINITTPFQVSFFGIPDENAHGKYRQLGCVLIPSLAAGTTRNISVDAVVDPAIIAVLVVADSAHVVSESNETNNQATISLPHHILWKSLIETTEIYKKLGDQYKVPTAEKVVQIAKDGLTAGVYADPVVFMRTLKTVAKLEVDVGGELKGQVSNDLYQKYQETVNYLVAFIEETIGNQQHPTHNSNWDDTSKVAEIQLQICDIILQMLH
ncbi:MAG: right-handed parallel beta-helix repeat-containing protein [Euryarchaeota archaeon]|nr:right-handed parallel beta-helix repeat-containing protein [Euryarchaeota archaeon]